MSTSPVDANYTGTEDDTVAANSPKAKDDAVPEKYESQAPRPKCPVCACPVDDNDLVTCPRCGTPHHRDCREYTGGCSMFDCDAGSRLPATRDCGELKRRIETWLYLYQASWGAFGTIALLTVAALPILIHIATFYIVFGILTQPPFALGARIFPYMVRYISYSLLKFSVLTALIVYALSFPVYAMTVIPARLMRRKLEYDLKTRQSIPATLPRSIGDKRKLLRLGKVFRTLTKILVPIVRLAMSFSLLGLAIFLASDNWPSVRNTIGILIILLFTERCALPAITIAMQRRGTYLASFQNKVAAMLEKGEKG